MSTVAASPVVVGGLIVTIAGVLLFVRTARRELPVRTGFDVARIVLAFVAVVAVAAITKVTTPVAFVIVALVGGGVLGYVQGHTVSVRVAGRRALARKNVAGIVLWGAGIVVMQISAVLARTGTLKAGQALAYFSVAMSTGLFLGRNERIRDLRRLAVAGGVTMIAGLMVLALPLAAGACCVDGSGDEGSGGEHAEDGQSEPQEGETVVEGESIIVVVTPAPKAPVVAPSQPRSAAEEPRPAAPVSTAQPSEELTEEPEPASAVPIEQEVDPAPAVPIELAPAEQGDSEVPANPGAAAAAGAVSAAAVGATALIESKRGRKKGSDHPDFLWFPRSTPTPSPSSPLGADSPTVPVGALVAEGVASGPTAGSSPGTGEAFEFVDKLVADVDAAPAAGLPPDPAALGPPEPDGPYGLDLYPRGAAPGAEGVASGPTTADPDPGSPEPDKPDWVLPDDPAAMLKLLPPSEYWLFEEPPMRWVTP